jgi:hypothetical protein
MMAKLDIDQAGVTAPRFCFIRHNAANESVPCALAAEAVTFARLAAKSAALGARLVADGGWVRVEPS